MATTTMLTVFSYDVADNRRRRRIAALLEDRAARVQQSVFEASLNERQAERLAARIVAEMGPGDSLRVYAVSRHARPRCRTYGGAPLAEEQDYYLV